MENIMNIKNNSTLLRTASLVNGANTNGKEQSTGILKYLVEIASRLTELKGGIEKNIESWENIPETPGMISEHIRETLSLGMEIDKLKKELSEKYMQARELRKNKKLIIATLEKRAVGVHAHQLYALADYGIKFKTNTTK